MQKQKYKRGNVVRIKIGEHSGERAVVQYSYGEKYGGNNPSSYSLILLRAGSSIAWFEEEALSFAEEGGEHLFRLARRKRERIKKRKTDLKWIVKNWKKIRCTPSSDTVLFLFGELDLKSSFLQNGEYGILYSDWSEWLPSFDFLINTKNESELLAVFKPETSESFKQIVIALFKKIRSVTPHHKGGCYGKERLE